MIIMSHGNKIKMQHLLFRQKSKKDSQTLILYSHPSLFVLKCNKPEEESSKE